MITLDINTADGKALVVDDDKLHPRYVPIDEAPTEIVQQPSWVLRQYHFVASHVPNGLVVAKNPDHDYPEDHWFKIAEHKRVWGHW